VLLNELRATARIAARSPRTRLDQYVHLASRRYAEQSEPEEPAKAPYARILFSTAAALRKPDRQPDLVGSCRTVNTLQHEVQIEAEFQLADDDDRRTVATQGNEVTAADLTLHVKSEGLEEPFDGQIKRSLQDISS
jgi:uncharacterized protein YfaQ (DUF2300 family)